MRGIEVVAAGTFITPPISNSKESRVPSTLRKETCLLEVVRGPD